MTIEEVAQIVMQRLEHFKIDYMVVGALAGNLHGVVRTTHDADIVIDCDKASLEKFLTSLQQDFYADKSMALDAYQRRTMFNIIHQQSGFKIDLIVRGTSEFSHKEFERRIQLPFRGTRRWVATPEDVILSKLLWFQKAESERQWLDAVSIAKIQSTSLDHNYLKHWSEKLNLGNLLKKLLDELDKS